MMLLVALWPGLAAAAALGVVVGGLAGRPAAPAVPLALLAAAAVLAAVALARVVPGLPGLWLESAALLLPAYLAGCAAGATLRHAIARHRAAAGRPPQPGRGDGGRRD